MKHLKKFEDTDGKELLSLMKSLSDQMSRLKLLAKIDRRKSTDAELYEDHFLDLKETDKFFTRIDKGHSEFGPIIVTLEKFSPREGIEKEFNKWLSKLRTVYNGLTADGYDCHFDIKLGGRSQAEHNSVTHKNDVYKFLGEGALRSGRDSNGLYHSDYISRYPQGGWGAPEAPLMSDDEIPVNIKFYII